MPEEKRSRTLEARGPPRWKENLGAADLVLAALRESQDVLVRLVEVVHRLEVVQRERRELLLVVCREPEGTVHPRVDAGDGPHVARSLVAGFRCLSGVLGHK